MNLSEALGKAAPWLAAAAAGPAGLAGMAIKAVAETLGASGKTGEDLAAAVTGATPEQKLAIRMADIDFSLKMNAMGFDHVSEMEALAVKDRADARAMQVANKSFMPAVITSGVLSSFMGVLLVLFFVPVPTENRDLIIYMVGQLSGFAGASVAFWLGTTRQSEDKTRLLAQAGPMKTWPKEPP